MRICTTCGNQLSDGEAFCSRCGVAFNGAPTYKNIDDGEGTVLLFGDEDKGQDTIILDEDDLLDAQNGLNPMVNPAFNKPAPNTETPQPKETQKPKKSKKTKIIVIVIVIVVLVVALIAGGIFGAIMLFNGNQEAYYVDDTQQIEEAGGDDMLYSEGFAEVEANFYNFDCSNMNVEDQYIYINENNETILEGQFTLSDLEYDNLIGYVNVYSSDGTEYFGVSAHVDFDDNYFDIWIDDIPTSDFSVEVMIEPDDNEGYVLAETTFEVCIE